MNCRYSFQHLPLEGESVVCVKATSGGAPRLFRNAVQAMILMLAVALTAVPMLAQNTTADVTGIVSDSTGAVVPGATVELTNAETQEKRVVTSGGGGEYTFTLLKPSRYSLSVAAPGFKLFKTNPFSLAAGDRSRQDSHLEIGGTGETVTVDAAPPGSAHRQLGPHHDRDGESDAGTAAERSQLYEPGAGNAGCDRGPQQRSCERKPS